MRRGGIENRGPERARMKTAETTAGKKEVKVPHARLLGSLVTGSGMRKDWKKKNKEKKDVKRLETREQKRIGGKVTQKTRRERGRTGT